MPATATEQTPRERLLSTAAALGLTMAAEFVPFSQSRHAKPGKDGKVWRSLNWRVTLLREVGPAGARRPILETDYSAGEGHTPAGKGRNAFGPRTKEDRDREVQIAWEIEHGRPAGRVWFDHSGGGDGRGAWATSAKIGGKAILPDFADVLASLALDSSVLNAGGFEDWASDLGYDADSRAAEATYRAALEIALKLRAGLGEEGLTALREAAQEF